MAAGAEQEPGLRVARIAGAGSFEKPCRFARATCLEQGYGVGMGLSRHELNRVKLRSVFADSRGAVSSPMRDEPGCTD